MAVLSRDQVAAYAAQAGFSGQALNVAVAIAQAESSFNTQAKLVNTDGSIDRGLWQINSRWHPEVSDTQAYDPLGAARAAFNISSRGTNFNPWVTYQTGAYKRYLTNVATSPDPLTGIVSQIQQITAQARADLAWTKIPITHGYITTHLANDPDSPHYAIDIGMPFHTRIGSAVAGTVKQADYAVWAGQPGGGEVFIQPDPGQGSPSGAQWYVYHLDQINVSVGQHVAMGDLVGLSGGQNTGGSHPVSRMWSTGPHLHTGWFTSYRNSAIGSRPYGPDITPYIQQLAAGNYPQPQVTAQPGTLANLGNDVTNYLTALGGLLGTATGITGGPSVLDQVHQTLINVPGFYGISLAVDEAEQLPGYVNLASGPFDVIGIIRSIGASLTDNAVPFLIRSGLVGIGLAIILLLVAKVVLEVGEKVAPLIAAAA